MKKLVCLVLTLCLTLMCASFAHADGIYLAIGDSITTGYGLNAEAGETGFAEILAKNNGYTLINKAVDGSTTADILALLSDPTLAPTVASAKLITLTCGGNDLMGLLYAQIASVYNAAVPVATMQVAPQDVADILSNAQDPRQMALLGCAQTVMQGNAAAGIPGFAGSPEVQAALQGYLTALNAIVGGLRMVNPTASIVITTQYNPYITFSGAFDSLKTGMDDGAKALSAAITLNAATAGYAVADVYTAFAASGEALCNSSMTPLNLDFHPNAQGHALIAQTIQSVLDAAK